MQERKYITHKLEPVISDIKDWPIYRLSQDKEGFLAEVKETTKTRLLKKHTTSDELHNLLKSVLYQEKNRLTQEPWKSDTKEERVFWGEIKRAVSLSLVADNNTARFISPQKKRY